MDIFIYSELIFLKILFYVLMIFLGLFEAKAFTSNIRISKNTLKYYIVSLSSFVISALLFTTVIHIMIYRLLCVMTVYGIWRYKDDSPVVTSFSLIMIQMYLGFVSLLIHFLVYLIIGF